MFGQYTKAQLLVGLKHSLSDITLNGLERLFTEAGFAYDTVRDLTETTWRRVKWLRNLADEPRPKPGSANLPPAFIDADRVTPAEVKRALFEYMDIHYPDRMKKLLFDEAEVSRQGAWKHIATEMVAALQLYTSNGYSKLNYHLFKKKTPPREVVDYARAINATLAR